MFEAVNRVSMWPTGAVDTARYALAISCAVAVLLIPPTPTHVAHATPVATRYSSGPLAHPIPDAGVTEALLYVGDQGTIMDVNVRVRINHTWVSDLDLHLVGPDGATVALSTGNGGGDDNYGSGPTNCSGTLTEFDDMSGAPITTAAAPFWGRFRPEENLDAFNGRQANGHWRLRVRDTGQEDVGTLFCWEVEIFRNDPTVAPPPSATADLRVLLTSTPNPVPAGTNILHNLTIINAGPHGADNPVAVMRLPSDVAFVSARTDRGSLCRLSGSAVVCDVGWVAENSQFHVEIITRSPNIQGGTTPLTFSASVQSSTPDPVPANNETPAQTVTALSCTPRPPITQTVVREGPGRLRVTVAAGAAPGGSSLRLQSIRFTANLNAAVSVSGQFQEGPFLHPLPERPTSVTFIVRRSHDAGGFTVPFIVADDCGERPSFVGGGPGV